MFPQKLVFFLLGRLGSERFLLRMKKMEFSLTSKCPFCGKAKEVMEHLFIHCPMIWSLWIALVSIHGEDWV